jgi:hypothetical protein
MSDKGRNNSESFFTLTENDVNLRELVCRLWRKNIFDLFCVGIFISIQAMVQVRA